VVDADHSEALAARVALLDESWRDAHLDATWDNGNETTLDLDVEASSAPICQDALEAVTIPVEVRYGTADGLVPVHDARGVVHSLLRSEDALVSLRVTEETDCSALQPSAAAGACETPGTARLELTMQSPNDPPRRLGRLTVGGGPAGTSTTSQVLAVAGTPNSVECLVTFDCAVDEICADGFCRAPATSSGSAFCSTDLSCGFGRYCRAGVCWSTP